MGLAILKIWRLLIFRDHWQGECCVALFAAIGWATISYFDTQSNQTFSVAGDIVPLYVWRLWLVISALIQLYGLFRNEAWPRLCGAIGILFAFTVIVFGVVAANQTGPGLSTYVACISIEMCAIVFQTAVIIRYRELPRWIWTLRR